MKKLELSTAWVTPLSLQYCTYHGCGKSEFVLNEDMMQENFEEGVTDVHPDYYYMHFDNKKYMEEWNWKVQSHIESILTEELKYHLGIDITYTPMGWSSPQYYNFGGDVNKFDIEAESFQPLLDYCLADQENFEAYLKEHFSSCDGFISFVSNNIREWKMDIEANVMTAWGAALGFFLEQEVQIYPDEAFTDMFYTEFVDYKELDEFLADPAQEPEHEWQKALLERGI